MTLLIRGVHYDVGHEYAGVGPGTTRPHFEPAEVAADMAMITSGLHANTVRVAGTDLSRLETATRLALEAGLTVWFSPHPADLNAAEIVDYLAVAAETAEKLRSEAGPVVLVAGCEVSLFGRGFLPGDTLEERLATLLNPPPGVDLATYLGALPTSLNATLDRSIAAIRERFHGQLSYASAPWETIDWAPFDFVAVDLYRDNANAAQYGEILRSYRRFGKPVVVTEFGCCTYRGAADAGGLGFVVVGYDAQTQEWRLEVPDLHRDEAEQSRYLSELLAVFEREAVDGAFWHTFAGWTLPHRADPSEDLDLASFGLVKLLDGNATKGEPAREPKEAFHAMARAYARQGS